MFLKKVIKKYIPKKILNIRHLFYAWYGAVKYKYPSKELLVIGITGTSGKSSTVYFLRQMLEFAGFKVGSLSTIDFYIDGKNKLNDRKMTMLGKTEIQKYLREMVNKGCEVAIVETTSEGQVQYRDRYIAYDIMVLTNLYPEHIESHGSYEKYKEVKLNIFRRAALYGNGKAWEKDCCNEIKKTFIVNGDIKETDEFLLTGPLEPGKRMVFGCTELTKKFNENKKLTYRDVDEILLGENIKKDLNGLSFTIGNIFFQAKIYGEHNVMNLLAAISVCKTLGIEWLKIQKSVEKLNSVPGRIEFIKEAESCGFKVIVDYAFEPVALLGLYKVVELLKPKRVIHVCGSTGGGRDKSRRQPIGRLVGEKSDIFIVTDEDPYEENPEAIINEVIIGAQGAGKIINENLFKILDRKEAIKKAIEFAEPEDLVLITGKGSEQAMCVSDGKMIPWDDRKIAREKIEERDKDTKAKIKH